MTERPHGAARLMRAIVVACAVAELGLATPETRPAATVASSRPVAVCFAPGTPASYVDEVTARLGGDPAPRFFALDRWSSTATDGFVAERGTPITLTWNVVPDGTSIPASQFGGGGPSDLRKALSGIHGSEAAWLALFEKTFARWGQVAGIRYVRETADDGVAISSAAGVRGVRADVRIAGRSIDGDFGVLAYNSFPNDSDMVLDSADAFYRQTTLRSRGLRNVVSHEHGHGLGLDHVCPLRRNKLMEPLVSLDFDGPQHDDILGAQRLYGDPREPNDTRATATDLGAVGSTRVVVEHVSVDGTSDTDLYAFTVAAGSYADVVLSPAGKAYDHAPETESGGCGPSTTRMNSRKLVDLDLAILADDGTAIATADAGAIGEDESLLDVPLGAAEGRFFVRVRGADPNDVQAYRLEVRAVVRGEKPVAAPDAAATFEVLPASTEVLANDTGLADEPLRLRVTAPPANGRALVAGRRIVYVPRRGFSGEDGYTYEVSDLHRQTSIADVTVTVAPSERAGDARLDADGDGYPDEFEAWRGTAADDPLSFPGEDLTAAGPAPLVLSRVLLRVESRQPDRDEIRVRGTLPVAADFAAGGSETVVVSVAGVGREITLDAFGRATGDAAGTFRLHVRRRRGAVVPGTATFELVLRRGSFAASWEDEGLLTDRRQRREPRGATLILQFAGRTYLVTAPLTWSADPGRRGATRLVR